MVRIEVEVAVRPETPLPVAWAVLWKSPCASRLSADRRVVPPRQCVVKAVEQEHTSACAFWLLGCHNQHPLPAARRSTQQPELHSLRYYAWDGGP
jgi:hypothetical protein